MKRIICVVLCVTVLFSFPINVFAYVINGNTYNTVQVAQSYFRKISELYNQRSFLQMEKYRNTNTKSGTTDSTIDDRIEALDRELEALGVRQINSKELASRLEMNVSVKTNGGLW